MIRILAATLFKVSDFLGCVLFFLFSLSATLNLFMSSYNGNSFSDSLPIDKKIILSLLEFYMGCLFYGVTQRVFHASLAVFLLSTLLNYKFGNLFSLTFSSLLNFVIFILPYFLAYYDFKTHTSQQLDLDKNS